MQFAFQEDMSAADVAYITMLLLEQAGRPGRDAQLLGAAGYAKMYDTLPR